MFDLSKFKWDHSNLVTDNTSQEFWTSVMKNAEYDLKKWNPPHPDELESLSVHEIQIKLFDIGFLDMRGEFSQIPLADVANEVMRAKDSNGFDDSFSKWGGPGAMGSNSNALAKNKAACCLSMNGGQDWNANFPMTNEWIKSLPYEQLNKVYVFEIYPGGYHSPHNHQHTYYNGTVLPDGKIVTQHYTRDDMADHIHVFRDERHQHFANMTRMANKMKHLHQAWGPSLVNTSITFPEGSFFGVNPHGLMPYKPGKSFWLNAGYDHSVANFSNESRYHIVIHGTLDEERFRKTVLESYRAAYEEYGCTPDNIRTDLSSEPLVEETHYRCEQYIARTPRLHKRWMDANKKIRGAV
jgi:hypothetical protein